MEMEYKNNKLMAIGCIKGSIVFVSVSNFSKIFARFSFHREKIIALEALYNKKKKAFCLISICYEKKLKVKMNNYTSLK